MRKILLVLAFTAVCLTGCKTTERFARNLRITSEPDDQFPKLDEPKQRLATTKTREDSSSLSKASSSDASPHVTRTASNRTTSEGGDSNNAQRTLSDQENRSDDQGSNETPLSAKAAKSEAAQVDRDVANLPDSESKELMSAFRDYPPEVQREALRRLAAATALRANQTAEPNEIELASEVNDVPALPEKTNTMSETEPGRIDSPTETSPAVAVSEKAPIDPPVLNDEVSAAPAEPASRALEESPLVMTEVEAPMVQAAVGVGGESDPLIRTVSADGDPREAGAISRAALDSSLQIDVDPTELTSQLSDRVLYASILKRLAKPKEGESESERLSRLIRVRHLMVLSGDPDGAVERMDDLPRFEQEFLRHQMLGLWTMIDPQGHPVTGRRFTAALPQIREAAKFAAAATDSLEVRSLAFCTEIESYGQITTFTGNRFDSGQQVILYCEIENFTVKEQEKGFETHLQGSYDIFNESNEKVVSQLLPEDQQISSNYLRDYFIAYQMHLPAQLSAGTYRLQLTMEDVVGKKYGQASIPFEITN
ncbi:MAG: hypothetical protein P1U77_15125 [Rubripirellula sp.]|jgi:hypothetical protein|nr:hypothetical protein [Planctomycetaceae bacterium]MDF1842767.1 hypothetical protein [Rubripirellula sp.]